MCLCRDLFDVTKYHMGSFLFMEFQANIEPMAWPRVQRLRFKGLFSLRSPVQNLLGAINSCTVSLYEAFVPTLVAFLLLNG